MASRASVEKSRNGFLARKRSILAASSALNRIVRVVVNVVLRNTTSHDVLRAGLIVTYYVQSRSPSISSSPKRLAIRMRVLRLRIY